jgi:ABC-2 type transport system ATP-binding protein
VLFLDEPTTGLDPTSRQRMWDVIRELVADGTTLLLTTQYLDEADALADAISVIDHGVVIAHGSAGELKDRVGGDRIDVTLARPDTAAAAALAPLVAGPVHMADDRRRLEAPIVPRPGLLTEVVRALDQAGVVVDDVQVHRPTLDDVFFTLTGRPTADEGTDPDAPQLLEVPA